LEHWLKDADLAGVRDKHALDTLPEEERANWQALWVDVADTLAQAQGKVGTGKKN
jgi:hypothetical protein